MILGGDFGLKMKKQRRGVPLNDAILQSILAWFRAVSSFVNTFAVTDFAFVKAST
jgi:hypothetical protein